MLISIGILAWNEKERIGATLVSLFEQTAFSSRAKGFEGIKWEIVVVPNGCSDSTADIARTSLAELVAKNSHCEIQWSVREVEEAGKSNAWNMYIHQFSSADADFIIMIDADIEFGERETIANTVTTLLNNPQADVAVDQPLKDAHKKSKNSFIEKISLEASNRSAASPPAIAGSFYCARANVLRGIWIPRGLPGEDGFVRSMVITNHFRSEIDTGKIVRAENASHYFETLTGLRSIFRHEVRMVIGTELNCYFTWDFLKFGVDPKGPGAGVVIRNNLERDPKWYAKFIQNSISKRGFWVLTKGTLFRRLRVITFTGGILPSAKRLVIGLLGFLLDIPVQIAANHKLKSGKAIGHW